MREKLSLPKVNPRSLGTWLLASGAILTLLLYRLLSLTRGNYSPGELAAHHHAQSWHALYNNPLELPYTFLVWLGATAGHHSVLLNRVVATLFAFVAAWLFYYIVTNWISRRIAILSTVLFVASNGYLHAARLGTAAVLQFGVLLLLALPILITNAPNSQRRRLFYLSAATGSALLYVPGMIWQLLLSAAMRRRKLVRILQRLSPMQKVASFAAFIVVAAPLSWAIYKKPSLVMDFTGLPHHLPTGEELLSNITTFVSTLFYHSGFSPEYVTHGSALVSAGELLLFVLGLYALAKPPRHNTSYFMLGSVVLSTVLVLLGSQVFLVTLIPMLYLVVAWGLYYFLDEWLTVFPRNPIARRVGVVLVSVVVAACVLFHLRSYFVAWPHNSVTRDVYSARQP
ncbi:MAG: hypothetical protein WBO35_05550 [Candidatus Saccharimonadales bacterium]